MELGERLEEVRMVPGDPDCKLLADSSVSEEDLVKAVSSGGNDDDCELSGVLSLLAVMDDEDDGGPVKNVVSSKEVNESV